MRRIYLFLVCLNLLFTGALLVYLWQKDSRRIAFIYSQRVFQEYEGTKYLMQRMSLQKAAQKNGLDSLAALIGSGRTDLQITYESKLKNYTIVQQQLSERYTAEIWKRINEGMSEYGRQNEFDYILGASGNGSLMYAPESSDITDDVIKYLNTRFDGN